MGLQFLEPILKGIEDETLYTELDFSPKNMGGRSGHAERMRDWVKDKSEYICKQYALRLISEGKSVHALHVLSALEMAVIKMYTDEGPRVYSILNYGLSSEYQCDNEAVAPLRKVLEEALKKLPRENFKQLYRGMAFKDDGSTFLKVKAGDEFVTKAFWSTAIEDQVTKIYGRPQRGKRSIQITINNALGNTMPECLRNLADGVEEVLLPPGTTFRVTSRKVVHDPERACTVETIVLELIRNPSVDTEIWSLSDPDEEALLKEMDTYVAKAESLLEDLKQNKLVPELALLAFQRQMDRANPDSIRCQIASALSISKNLDQSYFPEDPPIGGQLQDLKARRKAVFLSLKQMKKKFAES